ncbi:hypothetical protein GLYMA_16G043350v4 [Glycine max]|nr:hypothetical protein GLYMA_16G043350v4 [Glycine max]KAH1149930.1 hypothetical protein GYH30_044112 [Glycine max]
MVLLTLSFWLALMGPTHILERSMLSIPIPQFLATAMMHAER